MANSKFYIIPSQRTVTSGMKESGSYFLYPTNTIIMRYIFFFLFLFCITTLVNAENNDSCSTSRPSINIPMYFEMGDKMKLQESYKQSVYWKKYKRLKGCAFGALGLGVGGMFVGWVGVAKTPYIDIDQRKDAGKVWAIVFCSGLCLTVSSIPLFIISHKNKKKAKNSIGFSLNSSTIHVTLPNGMGQTQPALGVCINF
ncbi:hypothetical protein [Bacteroides sp. UBA939]|uniref:hypothetical protein n=1 Tax=Bacteroides sp. UBA939 TaxID=1946092 RepID=UPI0025C0F240|nr:hypothetical protein [Bacteroides sp. UBA939]